MAHFYGILSGSRGRATRCGTRMSGLITTAASWSGAVRVDLTHDDTTDHNHALVTLTPWHGHGVSRVLYDGPVDAPAPVDALTPADLSLVCSLIDDAARANLNAYVAATYDARPADADRHALHSVTLETLRRRVADLLAVTP